MLDRDRIIDAVDLGDLADELLGPRRGTTRSAVWPCPSREHAQTGRTPPVSIFRTGGGEERWHCHGCGIGGSAIDMVMAVRGVPVREALEELAGRAGQRNSVSDPDPVRPRPKRPHVADNGPAVSAPAGLAAYVDECADRLWRPDGRPVLRWLTHTRGLPEDVLRANSIGADPGKYRQSRPDGMPAADWAAVLPVYEGGRPVFAQLRSLNPFAGRPSYLNASSRLARNPQVGMYGPDEPVGRCVIVTEGVIDALSANAAGFRGAAVLGAALAGVEQDDRPNPVARRLASTGATLVIAFDADAAGDNAGKRLQQLLRAQGSKASRIYVPASANDLNAWMRAVRDWPGALKTAVRTALTTSPPSRGLVRR